MFDLSNPITELIIIFNSLLKNKQKSLLNISTNGKNYVKNHA